MKSAVISYTHFGDEIADKIKDKIQDVTVYKNREYPGGIKPLISHIFKSYDRIVFVSAAGIAVRMIAPYIEDKTKDPAVVVVDDMGRYAVSLLSGHIGGANEFAEEIADAIGAQAVITTASDGRGIESVDMFAKRYGFEIESMEDAKTITSIMVNGGSIGFSSEVKACIHYKNIFHTGYDGYIYVTSKENVECNKPCCILRPRNLNVGLGCRRGKARDEILRAIYETFKSNNLSLRSIKSVYSIDVKKDEKGILEACEVLGVPFVTFSQVDIQRIQDRFNKSSFVESKVGVTSVAEPCACLGGGDLIVNKTVFDGITVAVARED